MDTFSGLHSKTKAELAILRLKQAELERIHRQNQLFLLVSILVAVIYAIILFMALAFADLPGAKNTTDEHGNPIQNGTGVVYWGEGKSRG